MLVTVDRRPGYPTISNLVQRITNKFEQDGKYSVYVCIGDGCAVWFQRLTWEEYDQLDSKFVSMAHAHYVLDL